MTSARRTLLCVAFLAAGLGAKAALEHGDQVERPPLRRDLATLPLELGDWTGVERAVDPGVVEQAQTSEYVSRSYESPRYPGVKLQLWLNYSTYGTNLRHSPTICLPSAGWGPVESQTRRFEIAAPSGRDRVWITRLGYARSELVMHVGFWYYIFGEGKLERYVRQLPITSRSSHGRATRGSSMTVEVFCPGDFDPEGVALRDFARELIAALEPILPAPRATYHVP